MKPEPLKNKERYYLDGVKIHHTEDIKSAVEWLKKELDRLFNKIPKNEINMVIDEAFSDVVKEVKK